MTRIITAGSVVLSPADARMLYQAARLGELRSRYRVGDSRMYDLLTELSLAAFLVPAAQGSEPRQDAASEERRQWTTRRLARASGRSERSVRLDCQTGVVPASKVGSSWLVDESAAHTYIDTRRK